MATQGVLEKMFDQFYTEAYYFGSDNLKDPIISLAELWGKAYSNEEKMAIFMEIKEHNYIRSFGFAIRKLMFANLQFAFGIRYFGVGYVIRKFFVVNLQFAFEA